MSAASLDEERPFSEIDALSTTTTSSIEQRSSSLLITSSKHDLPPYVHKWTRRHAEKYLHIFYENEYLGSPLDVLKKIPNLEPLSKKQIQFIEKVQSFLHFDASYKKYDETYNFYTAEDGLKNRLDTVVQQLYEDTENNELIKFKVSRFLKCLHRFMINMEALRSQYQEINEGNFTQLLGSFAEMCCIEAVECSKANQSVWKNLKGTNSVVSKPDFRFYKSGLEDFNHFGDEEMVVSVIEIKQNSEKLVRRLEEMSLSSHHSCSSESMDKSGKPQIEVDLNERVIGQHAGELLLDLDKFCLKNKMYAEEDYIMTMPGMIVDGTQVYFTVLEMARSHHRKLRYNEILNTDTDKATVYYARPLDILVETDRCILIENFMRLNNI